jgi:hypothetical protein
MMGPLAFIFSVSRIVSPVLLIVLSSQVDVGLSVGQWLAYVILVIQAAVIALLFFVLLTKMVELLLRALGNVPFDEAKNAKAGGIGGALRRWDRSGKRRRQHPGQYSARRRSRMSRTSQTLVRANSNSSYANIGQYESSFPYPSSHEDHEGYVLSPMRYPQQSLSDLYEGPAAIPPGSYSSPAHNRAPPTSQDPAPASTGFQMVRGGKASDSAPYTMTLPAGAATARAPTETMHDPRATPEIEYFQHSGRPRARSFTADIEFVAPALAAPGMVGPELFSNAAHLPPPVAGQSTPQTGTQSSRKSKKAGGFFGSLGRKTQPEINSDDDSDETDEDELEEEGEPKRPRKSLWPFGKKQVEEEPQEHSFSVVRRPPPQRAPSADHLIAEAI